MDSLFGEGQVGLKVFLFVIVVLGLLALAFWLLRRFGGGRPGRGGARGRAARAPAPPPPRPPRLGPLFFPRGAGAGGVEKSTGAARKRRNPRGRPPPPIRCR